jgi:hypothetical protein
MPFFTKDVKDGPKRPFQIHLSTLLVLIFVLSGLLWLNLRQPFSNSPSYTFGWPFEVFFPLNGNFIWYQGRYGSWDSNAGRFLLNILFCIFVLNRTKRLWEYLSIRGRKILSVVAAVYVFFWCLTDIFGAPAASNAMYSRVKENWGEAELIRTTPTEFMIKTSYIKDVVFVTTPIPFVLNVRQVVPVPPPYDVHRTYYFWCFGKANPILDSPAIDGMRRK